MISSLSAALITIVHLPLVNHFLSTTSVHLPSVNHFFSTTLVHLPSVNHFFQYIHFILFFVQQAKKTQKPILFTSLFKAQKDLVRLVRKTISILSFFSAVCFHSEFQNELIYTVTLRRDNDLPY